MTKIIVVIGPGSIGQAIARRVGACKHVLLADLRQENADAAATSIRPNRCTAASTSLFI
jgi:predicted dinucleotide-binding enzyme